MKAELCKTCIHTKMCLHDKNLVGDTFVRGFSDLDDAWEKFKEWAKAGFPCDDYIPAADVAEVNRCKTCFHYKPREYGYNCTVMDWDASDDDYCSRWEAKDE